MYVNAPNAFDVSNAFFSSEGNVRASALLRFCRAATKSFLSVRCVGSTDPNNGLPISPAGRGELRFVRSIVAIYSIHIIIRMWFAFKLKFIVEDFLLYGSNDDVEHMHVVP